jgi:DNA-binding transcriptional ArsR family regulator
VAGAEATGLRRELGLSGTGSGRLERTLRKGEPHGSDELFVLFRALALSRVRWNCVCQLAKGSATAAELSNELGDQAGHIVYHLAILKADDVVRQRESDRGLEYSLNRKQIRALLRLAIASLTQ